MKDCILFYKNNSTKQCNHFLKFQSSFKTSVNKIVKSFAANEVFLLEQSYTLIYQFSKQYFSKYSRQPE